MVLITQSLIKDYVDYRISCKFPEKEVKTCGLWFKAKYVDGIKSEPTDAQRLGLYFEQFILGSNADGGTIEPELTKSGISAEYKRAEERAARAKELLDHYGWMGGEFQVRLQHGIFGTRGLDIYTDYEGAKAIVDVKYAGGINDKWGDYGWKPGHLEEKTKIIIQPIHLIWLHQKVYGTIPRFFFAVFSSKPEYDARVIEIIVDEERIERHDKEARQLADQLSMEIELDDWEPFPEVKACAKCPLFHRCPHKIVHPKIDTVYIA